MSTHEFPYLPSQSPAPLLALRMNCPVLSVVCSLYATCIFNICARATNNTCIWKALLIFIPYFKAYFTNDITDQVDQHFILVSSRLLQRKFMQLLSMVPRCRMSKCRPNRINWLTGDRGGVACIWGCGWLSVLIVIF